MLDIYNALPEFKLVADCPAMLYHTIERRRLPIKTNCKSCGQACEQWEIVNNSEELQFCCHCLACSQVSYHPVYGPPIRFMTTRNDKREFLGYNYSCSYCGKDCESYEEVEVEPNNWEFWLWCDSCKEEIFRKIYGPPEW